MKIPPFCYLPMKTLKEYISTVEGMQQMFSEINEIIDNFDFKAVHIAMEALSWAWSVPSGMFDEYVAEGKKVIGSPKYPELATYIPDYEDVIRHGRNFLYEGLMDAGKEDGYRYMTSSGGFELTVEVLDDETRKRVFGEDAPDDFTHSVETHFKFIVEDNLPKSW